MGYSFIASVSAGSSIGDSVTTGNINTTGADFLAAIASFFRTTGASDNTMSDSRSETWVKHAEFRSSVGENVVLYHVTNATGGANHNFTFARNTGAVIFASLAVLAFKGSLTNSTPFENDFGNTLSSGESINIGAQTPGQNNELVIVGLSIGANRTVTIDSGLTPQEIVLYSGGNHVGVEASYKIQTAAASISPTYSWTGGGNTDAAMNMGFFKSALTVTFRRTLSALGTRIGSRQVVDS